MLGDLQYAGTPPAENTKPQEEIQSSCSPDSPDSKVSNGNGKLTPEDKNSQSSNSFPWLKEGPIKNYVSPISKIPDDNDEDPDDPQINVEEADCSDELIPADLSLKTTNGK